MVRCVHILIGSRSLSHGATSSNKRQQQQRQQKFVGRQKKEKNECGHSIVMFRSPLPPPCENEIEIDCIVFYLAAVRQRMVYAALSDERKKNGRTRSDESENENESYSTRVENLINFIK